MAKPIKVLVEIELHREQDAPQELSLNSVLSLLYDMKHRSVLYESFSATVTDDGGEIIRETE